MGSEVWFDVGGLVQAQAQRQPNRECPSLIAVIVTSCNVQRFFL